MPRLTLDFPPLSLAKWVNVILGTKGFQMVQLQPHWEVEGWAKSILQGSVTLFDTLWQTFKCQFSYDSTVGHIRHISEHTRTLYRVVYRVTVISSVDVLSNFVTMFLLTLSVPACPLSNAVQVCGWAIETVYQHWTAIWVCLWVLSGSETQYSVMAASWRCLKVT